MQLVTEKLSVIRRLAIFLSKIFHCWPYSFCNFNKQAKQSKAKQSIVERKSVKTEARKSPKLPNKRGRKSHKKEAEENMRARNRNIFGSVSSLKMHHCKITTFRQKPQENQKHTKILQAKQLKTLKGSAVAEWNRNENQNIPLAGLMQSLKRWLIKHLQSS